MSKKHQFVILSEVEGSLEFGKEIPRLRFATLGMTILMQSVFLYSSKLVIK